MMANQAEKPLTTLRVKIEMAIAEYFLRSGERGHSARRRRHFAGGSRKNVLFKLSGNIPDRAGTMPALPR